MSDKKIERRYFCAAGESLNIVEDFMARRKEAFDAQDVLVAELGAKAIANSTYLIGFGYFESVPPAEHAWALRAKQMKVTKDGNEQVIEIYVPNKRRKAGRKLAARMEACKAPSFHDLHERLLGGWVMGGGFIHWLGIEKLGESWVLSVPGETVPADAVLMKESEYWLLVEAQAEAA